MDKRFGNLGLKFFVSLAVVAGGIWTVLNRQVVIDQARLLMYTPSVEVKQLADNTKLSDRGRQLFYVSDPKIQDSAAFNDSCSSTEQTIVLGCYKGQRIFLYNVTDTRFNGVKEVTAAHEMLHAAYERLGDTEKREVDGLLKPLIEGMKDQRMLDLIALYNKTEPGELYNEMHSILGTEYASLTPGLESYYKKYFEDRSVIVKLANQYQAIFTESKNKIDEYDGQLDALKPQIDQNNQTLKRLQTELLVENTQLNQYRSRGQISQYNQLVPGYNAKVTQFNELIEQTKALVSQYNTIVQARNDQVTAQANLYDSLNSNYQKVDQN